MPIRGLLYLARNFEAYIEQNGLNIYAPALQHLPLPRYVVFYNGSRDQPDRQELELRDAFIPAGGQETCLNCKATVLNINYPR